MIQLFDKKQLQLVTATTTPADALFPVAQVQETNANACIKVAGHVLDLKSGVTQVQIVQDLGDARAKNVVLMGVETAEAIKTI